MSEKQTVLVAIGGHGYVVLDALLLCGAKVAGILDPGKPVGSKHFEIAVLGGDEWLDQVASDSVVLVNGVGANPETEPRRRVFLQWKQRGFAFASVVHPSALLGREVTLAQGSQIMAGVVMQCKSSVAENAVVNTRASIDHGCRIGAHAFIGPGAILCGEVKVGIGAFVGAGATVLPGVTIGDHAIVGAGAVVTRDVASASIAVGTPAAAKGNRILPSSSNV